MAQKNAFSVPRPSSVPKVLCASTDTHLWRATTSRALPHHVLRTWRRCCDTCWCALLLLFVAAIVLSGFLYLKQTVVVNTKYVCTQHVDACKRKWPAAISNDIPPPKNPREHRELRARSGCSAVLRRRDMLLAYGCIVAGFAAFKADLHVGAAAGQRAQAHGMRSRCVQSWCPKKDRCGLMRHPHHHACRVRRPVVASEGRAKLRSRLIGIGSCAPDTVVTNADLEAVVDTSDEWISQRTGIRSRHLLAPGETLSDLGSKAAERAIEMAGVSAEDIDLVIFSTSSPDDLFGDAPHVARLVGAHNAVAFDLTAACSGFLFGVNTASQFLHNGAYSTVRARTRRPGGMQGGGGGGARKRAPPLKRVADPSASLCAGAGGRW